jgi:glycosyltransferase involved in cell wall biosynthesis
VVTSRFNGVSEIIEPGKSGLVLRDPLDAAEIAGCIEKLAGEETRREMGHQAQLAVRELTMERNTRESLAVIEQVLKEKSR